MTPIGIAAYHYGSKLNVQLTAALWAAGYEAANFDANELVTGDDYPNFWVRLTRAVTRDDVTRGLKNCASSRGLCYSQLRTP